MESSKHGIITPQCVDKMLSNNTFSETRIKRLLDGLIFVEKGLRLHMQCVLKMSRIYTLSDILSKIFVKKNEGKLGTFLRSWFDKIMIGTNLIFIKIYQKMLTNRHW